MEKEARKNYMYVVEAKQMKSVKMGRKKQGKTCPTMHASRSTLGGVTLATMQMKYLEEREIMCMLLRECE